MPNKHRVAEHQAVVQPNNLIHRCRKLLRKAMNAAWLVTEPRLFYRAYLERYWVFRQIGDGLLWFYFRFPRLFMMFALLQRKRSLYQLISLRSHTEQRKGRLINVETEATIEIPGPRFVGRYPIILNTIDIVQLRMPAIDVVEIPDAMVMGGTNLILVEGQAAHPDQLIPKRDMIPAELFGVANIDPNLNTIKLRLMRHPRTVERAISLLGQCTGNYAHWLMETLPKLLIVDGINEFDDLPLLVDRWIHPNIRRSIQLLSSKRRRIIEVKRWENLFLPSVVEISSPAYIPAEYRGYANGKNIPKPDPSFFSLSMTAMATLRSVAQSLPVDRKIIRQKKLYLQRKRESSGNPRFITNIEAAERLIEDHSFEAIDPSKLSFAEQIAIFRDAECIVAPVGAALANAIFAPAGCRIVALAAYYENADYYYFSNLMGVLGHSLHYVLGPQVETTGHIVHRNYSVDLEALREALDSLSS
jgi:hypothetical protein